jgi:hypothetical protein
MISDGFHARLGGHGNNGLRLRRDKATQKKADD